MREPCRKCGIGSMNGPHYEKPPFGEESLIYVCGTCGYEERRPTADAKGPAAQTVRDLDRLMKSASA